MPPVYNGLFIIGNLMPPVHNDEIRIGNLTLLSIRMKLA